MKGERLYPAGREFADCVKSGGGGLCFAEAASRGKPVACPAHTRPRPRVSLSSAGSGAGNAGLRTRILRQIPPRSGAATQESIPVTTHRLPVPVHVLVSRCLLWWRPPGTRGSAPAYCGRSRHSVARLQKPGYTPAHPGGTINRRNWRASLLASRPRGFLDTAA